MHHINELTRAVFKRTASLPPLCAIFGSLFVIAPMQIFGRKKALMGLTIPGIIGFLLMGFTVFVRDKSILYVGRILTGLMGGATTPASQIYVIKFQHEHKIISKLLFNHSADYRERFTEGKRDSWFIYGLFSSPGDSRGLRHWSLC